MIRVTFPGLVATAALTGCVSTGSYDTSRAWSDCGEIAEAAQRNDCIERRMADYAAERSARSAAITHDTQVRERRAGELEALGVPEEDRATGPVVPQ